jgi:nucleoside-diphosphate-sugar epimerase
VDVVTGAFSYTGSFIAQALLDADRSVVSLSRRPPSPDHDLAGRVAVAL